MSNDQSNIISFTDDDLQLNDETSLLLEKLIDLKGESFINIFIDCGINVESLKYMTTGHLNTICPSHLFRQRIIFKHNLRKCQEQIDTCNNSSSINSINSIKSVSCSSNSSSASMDKDMVNIKYEWYN